MKLFIPVLSTVSNLLLLFIEWAYYIPQAADACAGYPVTHYNLSFGSSDVNQSMLGPCTKNGASRVKITLNSTDGILQNVRYHFQILAVNIIGSNTSSGMEFCKS